MKNMPVEYYEYYTLLEPFITGYYEVGQPEKATTLFHQVAKKYQEKLDYFSTFSYSLQSRYSETIYIEIERYRSLVGTLFYSENEELLKKEAEIFNSYLKKFSYFSGAEDELDVEEDLYEDSIDVFDGFEGMDNEEIIQLLDSLNTIK